MKWVKGSFGRSSNALGFELYQRLRAVPGNLVISPVSITSVLALV